MLIRRIVSLAVGLLAAAAIAAASEHFTPRRGHWPRPGRPRLVPRPQLAPLIPGGREHAEEMTAMYSCLSSQVAAERHRDLLADASAERLARQARTGRQSPLRRTGRAWRPVRRPRPVTRMPA